MVSHRINRLISYCQLSRPSTKSKRSSRSYALFLACYCFLFLFSLFGWNWLFLERTRKQWTPVTNLRFSQIKFLNLPSKMTTLNSISFRCYDSPTRTRLGSSLLQLLWLLFINEYVCVFGCYECRVCEMSINHLTYLNFFLFHQYAFETKKI